MKYRIHNSVLNGRPLHVVFYNYETLLVIGFRFGLYMNSNLRYSPKSLLSYTHDICSFLNFLDSHGFLSGIDPERVLGAVKKFHVLQFFLRLKNDGKADATLRSKDIRLRTFFNWLYSFKSDYGLNYEDCPYRGGILFTPKPYRNSVKSVTYIEVA